MINVHCVGCKHIIHSDLIKHPCCFQQITVKLWRRPFKVMLSQTTVWETIVNVTGQGRSICEPIKHNGIEQRYIKERDVYTTLNIVWLIVCIVWKLAQVTWHLYDDMCTEEPLLCYLENKYQFMMTLYIFMIETCWNTAFLWISFSHMHAFNTVIFYKPN